MTVAVVGGGTAGLVAARDLAAAGRDVVLLESTDRLGGTVASHVVAGLTLDSGADSYATRSSAVAGLLADLGLGDDVVAPRPGGAWVQLADRAAHLPATGVLGIPGHVWAADVRDVVGVVGAVRASIDRALPGRWGTADGASLGHLVRVRMGRRVHDRLVAPVVRGVHSGNPGDLDIDVVPGLRAAVRRRGSLAAAASAARSTSPSGSAVAGLDGGMHRMVAALRAEILALGGTVRTDAPVLHLARSRDGWRLGVGRSERPENLDADQVVLAIPGPALGRLVAPDLPGLLSGPAPRPGPAIVLVTLVVDVPDLDDAPRGTGVLVADGTAVRARALTHATAKWAWLAEAAGPGRHVLRLSYGPTATIDGFPPHAVMTERLGEQARVDAELLLGVRIPATSVVAVARTIWAGGQPAAGAAQRQWSALVAEAMSPEPGITWTGAWAAGTGLAAVVAHARASADRLLA